mmetsp:Transcript_16956/g.30378  ORF Transcript_16956/g.30378 Transcript_16956/m.30378 type:complete len:228 (-) Transcript_16956:1204-1887(-)
MHTERNRRFDLEVLIDVSEILVVRHRFWRWELLFGVAFTEWEELYAVEKLGFEVELHVCHVETAIPVVRDVATVQDFSEDVPEIRPWNLITSSAALEVVAQYFSCILKITSVERIQSVPAFRSKLAALDDDGVVVTKGEQNHLHLAILVLELFFLEGCERPLEVLCETLRRLVGQLDRTFEQADRNLLTWLGGEEEPEVWMVCITGCVVVESLFELSRPRRHKVDVF